MKSCSNSMDYVIPVLVVNPKLNSCWKFMLLCVHILLDFGGFVTIVNWACVYILLSSKMENWAKLGKIYGEFMWISPFDFLLVEICIFLENISWLIFKYPLNVVVCVNIEFCWASPKWILGLKKKYLWAWCFPFFWFCRDIGRIIKKREDNKFFRDMAKVLRREKIDPKVFRREKATNFCVILIEKSYL